MLDVAQQAPAAGRDPEAVERPTCASPSTPADVPWRTGALVRGPQEPPLSW